MPNIFVSIEKGIELAAEDALHWIVGAEKKIASATPGAVAAVAVLAGQVEKVLSEISADAANPVNIVLQPHQLNDLRAVWPDVKAFLLTLGIKL